MADEVEDVAVITQPFWYVPPPKPTTFAEGVKASGIADVMQWYLAKGECPLVLHMLRGQREWISTYATAAGEPLDCHFSDTCHYQTFGRECERAQTFRFEPRVGGHMLADRNGGGDTDSEGGKATADESPVGKKRRLEKGKGKEGEAKGRLDEGKGRKQKEEEPLLGRVASSISLVAFPVNNPDCPEEEMEEDAGDPPVEEADDFRCPLCPDARFTSARALERHLESCGLEERTEEPIYTCPLCARTFPAQDELMVHSATCGEDVDAPAVARCAFCSARFDSAQSVLEHRCESAWAVDPANACPICQDSFPR